MHCLTYTLLSDTLVLQASAALRTCICQLMRSSGHVVYGTSDGCRTTRSSVAHAKADCIHVAICASCAAGHRTVQMAAANTNRKKPAKSVCGVQIVHSLPPTCEHFNQQRIQQQLSPLASISSFVWTGEVDTPEEVERLKLHLQALTGVVVHLIWHSAMYTRRRSLTCLQKMSPNP